MEDNASELLAPHADMELDPFTEFGDLPPLVALAENIDAYMSPLLLVVGSLGNVTSLVVLSRLSRKVLSTCLYLAVLCVADLMVLYTRCGDLWLSTIVGYELSWSLMIHYDIICKSLPFAFNFTFHLSKWLVVATAIEGVIAAGFPQSVPRRCTLTYAKAVIMLLTSILICVNVHYFWSFDRVSIAVMPGGPRTWTCTFTQNELRQSVFFQTTVWPALDKVVAELLPIGSLLVCSAVTIVCLARGRHRGTAAYRQWRQRYTLEPLGVEQLVWMCVNVGLMTACLTVPLSVVNVVRDIASRSASDVPDYDDEVANTPSTMEAMELDGRMTLFVTVCTQAQYCCLSLKIFVYIASSARFRRELRSIFHLGGK